MHNLLEPSPTNLMMIITTMPTPFLILELTLVHSPILVRVVEPHLFTASTRLTQYRSQVPSH
jgi:hypothetical protein